MSSAKKDSRSQSKNEKVIKVLLIKKNHIIEQLRRFEKFINQCNETTDKEQISIRLNRLTPILGEFQDVMRDLEVNMDWVENNDEIFAELDEFENSYYATESTYRSYLNKFSDLPSNSATPSVNSDLSEKNLKSHPVRLPQIDLPIFSGDFRSWVSFKDNFLSLIHNNKSMSNTMRMHYLKSCLKGEPLDLIDNLSITESNYSIAWNLIVSTFDNNRLISNSHVETLLDLPKMRADNYKELSELSNEFFKQIRALKNLNKNTQEAEFILVPLLMSKLHPRLSDRFQESLATDEAPTLSNLEAYFMKQINIKRPSKQNSSDSYNYPNPSLSKVAKSLGNVNPKSKQANYNYAIRSDNHSAPENGTVRKTNLQDNIQPSYPISNNKGTSTNQIHTNVNQLERSITNKTVKLYPCYVCQQPHRLYLCPNFLAMNPNKRYEFVQSKGLCLNCFNNNHKAATCNNKYVCKKCKGKHNTLLHLESFPVPVCHSFSDNSPNAIIQPKVLLATALVDMIGPNGNSFTVRALLDSGAQGNFICQSLVQKLQFKKLKCNVPVHSLGDSSSNISYQVQGVIKSRINDFTIPLKFYVIKKITGQLPQSSFDFSEWNIPPNIKLADPTFNIAKDIDILIGAEYFFNILCDGKLVLSDTLPVLQCTQFGWIISGKYSSSSCSVVQNHLALSEESSKLDLLLSKFWELDQCNVIIPPLSSRDNLVEQFYDDTVQRLDCGRYQVRLPFIKDPSVLGNSYETALKCLYSLERKLIKNTELQRDYIQFMEEYESLGHMTELPPEDYDKIMNSPHYFLPHHAVLRTESLTTKLRVVFNGSMSTSSGVSLNQILATGPPILNDSFDILVRFRTYKYALIGDVAKMYRQIRIHPSDAQFQLIVWRSNPSEPLKIFLLQTVTYGTTSAPYLAIKTIHKMAQDSESNFPSASKVIKRDVYVDDLISGEQSVPRLLQLQKDLTSVFQSAGMELRKWCSNMPTFQSNSNDEFYVLSQDHNIKTLGMSWRPCDDVFQYHVSFPCRKSITKRTVVSDVCRIFDPLGLLGPLVLLTKVFIQNLWLQKLGWDDEFPLHLQEEWLNLTKLLQSVNLSNIPRCVVSAIEDPAVRFELHGFCDASERGYGACIYLKCLGNKNSCQLICSKSRVAPTRVQSIPRLELCGALLLSELCSKVSSSLQSLSISKTFLWTDSMIVIYWLASEACRWKTFISNRVSKIQSLTEDCKWLHITSDNNPADLLSRGSKELSDLWWNGPSFLCSISNYPLPEVPKDLTSSEEKVVSNYLSVNSCTNLNDSIPINKFSSWTKLSHVVAYILRFIKNSKSLPNERTLDSLISKEIEKAEITIIKYAQSEMFSEEIKILKSNKPLPNTNRLLSLAPFMDKDDILRVGGRLKHALIPLNQKHQILLSSKHPVTLLLIKYYHKLTLHSGPQGLLYAIRQRFWPIDGKNLCKKIVRSCTICFRLNPSPAKYFMADLPQNRVNISKPFTNTGLDFAGPIIIRQSMNRKSALVKAYICLFVCLATKAIHLEPVSDLTTSAFLAALRRFIARRGICKNIYCDNGRNFLGARNTLDEIYELHQSKKHINTVTSILSDSKITFNFIPSRSPSFGGLWEAGVKSTKHHLRRTMGLAHFTFEELCTILCQIEAQLNSRPISPLSTDPNDLNALSPAHFLVGEPLTTIPNEPNILEKSMTSLKRWQKIQRAQQEFWIRWRLEYLGQLQQRSKWKRPSTPLKEGTLVLLLHENTSPLHWPLGRVTLLHPGSDGIARVATIKTSTGTTRRAINKLCPLPIETQDPQKSHSSSIQDLSIN